MILLATFISKSLSIQGVKNLLIDKTDPRQTPNVIIVDWRQWSQNFAVTRVKANSLVVGLQVEAILWLLTQAEDAPRWKDSYIFMMGHSFGGQIIGYAGHVFSETMLRDHNKTIKVQAITAIDPSDQCFTRGEAVPLEWNITLPLHPSSARMVKVLHTSGDVFGTFLRLGAVDIFVNGGGDQPDCPINLSSLRNFETIYFLVCNHYRAVRSILVPYYETTKCQPIAYACSAYSYYEVGGCGCDAKNEAHYSENIKSDPQSCTQLAGINLQIAKFDPDVGKNVSYSGNIVPALARNTWFISMMSEEPFCGMITFKLSIFLG